MKDGPALGVYLVLMTNLLKLGCFIDSDPNPGTPNFFYPVEETHLASLHFRGDFLEEYVHSTGFELRPLMMCWRNNIVNTIRSTPFAILASR